MSANLQQLIETKSKAIRESNSGLVKQWGKYIGAVDQLLQEREGKRLTESQKAVVARCLENALVDASMKGGKRLFETTFQSDISFLGIQLPVIAALIPTLALNELAVVQALDRRQGAVFYLDVRYGTNKGAVAAGTDMISAKSGREDSVAGRKYATNRITAEAVTVTGSDNAGILARKPVVAGSVVVVYTSASVTVTATDNSNGALSDGGTIDYATGAISLGAASDDDTASVTYRFDMGRDTDGVGEVDFKLTSDLVNAEDFKLRSKYEMGAAIDLEKAHGIVLDDEMVKFLGAEIKFEIDHMGIDQIISASQGVDAAAPVGDWNASVTSGQEWVWKKHEFKKYLELGNNNIFAKTKRAYATAIVCGLNVAAVFRQLTDNGFKPANVSAKAPAGPHVIGTMDGRTVVVDPFIDMDHYTMLFKGDSMLYGCFGYFPYIPLFSTPTLVTSDLQAQKGFMSAAGFKVLNAGMLTSGSVSNVY